MSLRYNFLVTRLPGERIEDQLTLLITSRSIIRPPKRTHSNTSTSTQSLIISRTILDINVLSVSLFKNFPIVDRQPDFFPIPSVKSLYLTPYSLFLQAVIGLYYINIKSLP